MSIRTVLPNMIGATRCCATTLPAVFLCVACPEHFPTGTLLGPFRNLCTQRVGTPQQILDAQATEELRNLVEFANRFHHDTNAAWETAAINDGELQGFVQRALIFVRP